MVRNASTGLEGLGRWPMCKDKTDTSNCSEDVKKLANESTRAPGLQVRQSLTRGESYRGRGALSAQQRNSDLKNPWAEHSEEDKKLRSEAPTRPAPTGSAGGHNYLAAVMGGGAADPVPPNEPLTELQKFREPVKGAVAHSLFARLVPGASRGSNKCMKDEEYEKWVKDQMIGRWIYVMRPDDEGQDGSPPVGTYLVVGHRDNCWRVVSSWHSEEQHEVRSSRCYHPDDENRLGKTWYIIGAADDPIARQQPEEGEARRLQRRREEASERPWTRYPFGFPPLARTLPYVDKRVKWMEQFVDGRQVDEIRHSWAALKLRHKREIEAAERTVGQAGQPT